VLEPPPRQTAPVNAIAAVQLRERTLLATGGDDWMVRIWDPLTGEPFCDALAGHSGPVNAIASVRLPGGPTLLATGGDDKTILIWTFG
jgi:WD40 repeat protein